VSAYRFQPFTVPPRVPAAFSSDTRCNNSGASSSFPPFPWRSFVSVIGVTANLPARGPLATVGGSIFFDFPAFVFRWDRLLSHVVPQVQ